MSDVQYNLLRAHAALALAETLGRRPTDDVLQLLLGVLSKAVVGINAPRGAISPGAQSSEQGDGLC